MPKARKSLSGIRNMQHSSMSSLRLCLVRNPCCRSEAVSSASRVGAAVTHGHCCTASAVPHCVHSAGGSWQFAFAARHGARRLHMYSQHRLCRQLYSAATESSCTPSTTTIRSCRRPVNLQSAFRDCHVTQCHTMHCMFLTGTPGTVKSTCHGI